MRPGCRERGKEIIPQVEVPIFTHFSRLGAGPGCCLFRELYSNLGCLHTRTCITLIPKVEYLASLVEVLARLGIRGVLGCRTKNPLAADHIILGAGRAAERVLAGDLVVVDEALRAGVAAPSAAAVLAPLAVGLWDAVALADGLADLVTGRDRIRVKVRGSRVKVRVRVRVRVRIRLEGGPADLGGRR